MSHKRRSFRPQVEALEDRLAPAHNTVTLTAPARGPAVVKVFNTSLQELASFSAFDFEGEVRAALADVNGDKVFDVILGAGPGAPPLVKVVDGTRMNQVLPNGQIADSALLASFSAFEDGMRAGVFIAGGHFDRDGRADIAVATGSGVPGLVRTFSIVDGLATQFPGRLGQFAPYGASFSGGITLAAGDLDGDNDFELITGMFRGGTVVKAFDAVTGDEVRSFVAFPNPMVDGVNVSAEDMDGDGRDDLLLGSAVGGKGEVKVVSGDSQEVLLKRRVMGKHYEGGTRIAAAINSVFGLTIITANSPGTGRAEIIISSATTGERLAVWHPYGPEFTNGAFVAHFVHL